MNENGDMWCRQHAPSAAKARKAANDAKRQARWDAIDQRNAKKTARRLVAGVAISYCRGKGTREELEAAVLAYEALP